MMKKNQFSDAVSVLQRTKLADGTYIITLPVTTSEEVYTDINTGERLDTRLKLIDNTESTIVDDIASLLLLLQSLVTGTVKLNHVYKTDFKNIDDINMTAGDFEPGSLSGTRLSYQLNSGLTSSVKPSKISIKDVKNREVNENEVSVYVSVNFDDVNVYWIDCTQEYLQNKPIAIPNLREKEQNIPWSINVKFVFKCENNSPVIITDLAIAHI